jgi:acyl carrier protein
MIDEFAVGQETWPWLSEWLAGHGREGERVLDDARLMEDLGLDSLELLELRLAAEESFGAPMGEERALQIHTVADLRAWAEAQEGPARPLSRNGNVTLAPPPADTAERPVAAAAPMQSGRVRLRPIAGEDYEYLFNLSWHPDVAWRWEREPARSLEFFAQQVAVEPAHHFIVEGRETGEPIGWTSAWKLEPNSGYAYIGMIMDPAYVATGLGAEASVLFVNWIFTNFSYRKLYSEALDYTVESFQSSVGRFFHEEGVLRAHEYYQGRYWDLHILALYRDDWTRIAPAQLAALRAHDDA